jgi:integrase/recombinase XerD
MLERYFVRPRTVDRVRSSWIGEAVERYVAWLAKGGYSDRTVWTRVPILIRFGEFAQERGADKWEHLVEHVEPFVRMWVSQRASAGTSVARRRKFGHGARNPIRQMLRLVIPGYVGRGRSRKPENPFEECAPHFFRYLREERGLREGSIERYSYSLRMLASYLQRAKLTDIAHLSPAVLSGFVTDVSPRLGLTCLRDVCGVVRVFLRYLHRERVLCKDLSSVIEHPQRFRCSRIPRSISWDEVRRVLETIDRRTATGKRDYAMLLLLVTYGLRACEVAALTLDDIDWRNDRLRVPQRKAGHSTAYPLSPLVGGAILDYLRNGRPETSDRHLFFRSVGPRGPIGNAVVANRATYYLRKAGIRIHRAGSHTFRHTCVQRLVDTDFSLKTIGDYVGHRNPLSTQIYTKVAIESLRQLALGDGEEVL